MRRVLWRVRDFRPSVVRRVEVVPRAVVRRRVPVRVLLRVPWLVVRVPILVAGRRVRVPVFVVVRLVVRLPVVRPVGRVPTRVRLRVVVRVPIRVPVRVLRVPMRVLLRRVPVRLLEVIRFWVGRVVDVRLVLVFRLRVVRFLMERPVVFALVVLRCPLVECASFHAFRKCDISINMIFWPVFGFHQTRGTLFFAAKFFTTRVLLQPL